MEGAGVEGYRPEDWEPEETRQLDELVNQLGDMAAQVNPLPSNCFDWSQCIFRTSAVPPHKYGRTGSTVHLSVRVPHAHNYA